MGIKKTAKAIWKVLHGTDVNSEKPVKVKKRSKTDIEKHMAQLEKEKAAATAREEPWVSLVTMDVDYNDITNGAFELDWNDKFIAQLMRFGYQGKEDSDLVDQWFTDVCRNVVLETFEQEKADPGNRKKDLGGGRSEYT